MPKISLMRKFSFDAEAFGKEFERIRRVRRVSSASLAGELGVHPTSIYRIEIGAVKSGWFILALAKWADLDLRNYVVLVKDKSTPLP